MQHFTRVKQFPLLSQESYIPILEGDQLNFNKKLRVSNSLYYAHLQCTHPNTTHWSYFHTSTRKNPYMAQIKKKKTVKLLIFMNVVCVAMSLGNEHYSKTLYSKDDKTGSLQCFFFSSFMKFILVTDSDRLLYHGSVLLIKSHNIRNYELSITVTDAGFW